MSGLTPKCLLALGLAVGIFFRALGQEIVAEPAVRFAALDVFIESRVPVAAWQFELAEKNGLMTVVGIENGDSAAFAPAPYYDLEAVERRQADRVIVADFSLESAAALPVGRTRIATIHVRLSDSVEPDYEVRLLAAGDPAGKPIDAVISLDEGTER